MVHLTGHGLGGRNQELALAAAEGLAGLEAVVASVGSDGTDGPTDAAGGITDGATADAGPLWAFPSTKRWRTMTLITP